MKLLVSPEINVLAGQFADLIEPYLAELEDKQNDETSDDDNVSLLMEAMVQLFELCTRVARANQKEDETPENIDWIDVSEIGVYGISLFSRFSDICAKHGLAEEAEAMESLCFPFAVWLSRQGAELNGIEPVINAFARLANNIQDPCQLEELFHQSGEVMEAVSPQIQQDIEAASPNRPWRVLILNRAIVATRCNSAVLMQDALQDVLDYLPTDAPEFFSEGMLQMDALDYPQHVRQVMASFYNKVKSRQHLH